MTAVSLIDHVARDLPIWTAVRHVLAPYGHGIQIERLQFINDGRRYNFFERTRPEADLLVTPSYNVRRMSTQLARASRLGARLVVAHSEQIIPEGLYAEKLNAEDRAKARRDVEAHLVWGPEFGRAVVEVGGADPENVFIVGNPKVDLAARLPPHKADEGRPMVLFVSDFRLADYDDEAFEAFLRSYRATLKMPAANRQVRSYREKFLELAVEAAHQFPGVDVHVRPHPGEDRSPYHEALGGIENARTTGDAPFTQDLQQSDLVVAFASTAVFEAFAAGIPVLNIRLGDPIAHYGFHDHLQWSDRAELLTAVQDLERGERAQSARGQRALDASMHVSGGSAVVRHAAALLQIAERSRARRSFADHVRIGRATAVAAAKAVAVPAGYVVKHRFGIDNPIWRFSEGRSERFRVGPEALTPSAIADADAWTSELVTGADTAALSEVRFRAEPEGTYVEVPTL